MGWSFECWLLHFSSKLPVNVSWRAAEGGLMYLLPCTHVEDTEEAPGLGPTWLQPGSSHGSQLGSGPGNGQSTSPSLSVALPYKLINICFFNGNGNFPDLTNMYYIHMLKYQTLFHNYKQCLYINNNFEIVFELLGNEKVWLIP